MVKQLPLDQVYLVSIWLEALVYGFLLCLFLSSMYVNLTLRRHQDGHSRIMFYVGIIMFFIACLHVSMNCYRMIQGYVIHAGDPGGPAAWISALPPWHHVFKDTLYATQEMLGDGVAVYRTYVIWGHNWKIVVVPCALMIVSIVSGYTLAGLYTVESSASSVFNPRLLHWITTFYAVSLTQSFLTTMLMAYRIWTADRRSARYRANRGNLLPVMRILVESAALQLLVEFILLIMYAINLNAQTILLELVTPLVAITFNAITIRIALRSRDGLSLSHPSQQRATEPHAATIGSIQLRPIAINIHKDIETRGDGQSDDRLDFSESKQGQGE